MSLIVHLCSGSPRRVQLLRELNVVVHQHTPDFDEAVATTTDAISLVTAIAAQKLEQAVAALRQEGVELQDESAPILVADTIVHTTSGRVLGKPESATHAAEMLRTLSGGWHQVTTAYGITNGQGLVHQRSVTTDVEFFALSEDEILRYVVTGECDDKAGSYGIQGFGRVLVAGIRGSYTNVVGLPVARVMRDFEMLGFPHRM